MANTLTFLGYQPIWQDIFGTEGGDLRGLLRKQIDQCKGVVQLVGQCYGAEPPIPDEEFGRVSYTQYEALCARKCGKKVWYLFIGENFPADDWEVEPEDVRELQAAYRRRLQSDTHVFHPLTSSEALEASVLKLRDDLTRLRRGVKQWAVGVSLLLILTVVLGVSILQRQQRTTKEVTETNRALISVQEKMNELLRQGVSQFAGVETKIRQERSGRSAAERQQRIYDELGKQLGVDPQLLREKLSQFARELQNAPGATTFERANAAYVSKDYAAAERLALVAADEAQKADPSNIFDAIKALELAGRSADARIEYAEALRHFRDAEKLTHLMHNPTELRRNLQLSIAWVLQEQGKYADAEMIFRALLYTEKHATDERNQAAKAAQTQKENEYWITHPQPPEQSFSPNRVHSYPGVRIVGEIIEKNKDLGLLVRCDPAPGSADNESAHGVILLIKHPDFRMLVPGDRVEVRGVAVGTQEYRPPIDVLNSDVAASLGPLHGKVITVHVYQSSR